MKQKIFFITIFSILSAFFVISGQCRQDSKALESLGAPIIEPAKQSGSTTLIFFYSPTCYECIQTKNEVMPFIEKQFKGRLVVEYKNVEIVENYKLLLSLQEKHKVKGTGFFPVFYLENEFLNIESEPRQMRTALSDRIEHFLRLPVKKENKALPSVDLVKRFEKFTPFAIISVGLLDGVNPCAITVIVFFMSFLAMRGYRKREIVLIGLLFIFSVYLTYVLIGLGTLEFIYRIQGFWFIAKIVNIAVGIFSIVMGFAAIYDYIAYTKTQETDGLILQLPKPLTERIHKIIRRNYNPQEQSAKDKKPMLKLAAAALVTGFLVSILEAVCVVKIYLPTIIFILKTTGLKLKAVAYLLLYNLLFIIPLIAIFFFALAGTTSGQFSAVLKKHMGALKILMAILFIGLGIFLIWRA
jgi:cytochrome c biogenesis protein CcdA